MRSGTAPPLAAPDQCPDARLQFVETHRLDHVVVGAEIEEADPLLDGKPCRQDENGRLLAAGTQTLQYFAAIQSGQAEIEDGQIVTVAGQQLIRSTPIGSGVHKIAGMAQCASQSIGKQGIVFNQQNTHKISQNSVRPIPYDSTLTFGLMRCDAS